jgi:hypothetical protein
VELTNLSPAVLLTHSLSRMLLLYPGSTLRSPLHSCARAASWRTLSAQYPPCSWYHWVGARTACLPSPCAFHRGSPIVTAIVRITHTNAPQMVAHAGLLHCKQSCLQPLDPPALSRTCTA